MPTETDEEIKAAADALLEKGVSKVVVTLGARGAMLADGNEKLFFEAKPVVPVDTTAAGAAFTAAMVNGLAQEMGMIQAIRMATVWHRLLLHAMGHRLRFLTGMKSMT